MGLIANVLEARGITTVCLQLVREIAEAVGPPRSLVVPFPFGSPLGRAGDAALQRDVIASALALVDAEDPPPVLRDYG